MTRNIDHRRLSRLRQDQSDVANHVMYLYNGSVEEEGPPAKVFGSPDSERCRQFVTPRAH